ncbi:hypothetical protein EGW08_013495 [Elysia chlorotica]|uniref:Protein NATD1 n=1 Tax=Elysia chlorotica TaxID=188477 RepID=A0A433TBC0_ELYCH|nr:hypothetical protein EGW08_013495 [Elysia chlorotica]
MNSVASLRTHARLTKRLGSDLFCSASLHWNWGRYPSILALELNYLPRTFTRVTPLSGLKNLDLYPNRKTPSRSRYSSKSNSFYKDFKQTKLEERWQGINRLFGTSTDDSGVTMSVPSKDFVVGHDPAQKMFYVELKDKSKSGEGSVAKLEYEWLRPGLVDLHHTETPPAFQGRGIAKILVVAGLDHFCEQGVLIRPTCTYVQKVLRENLTSRYKEHVEPSYLSSL